MDTLNTLHFNPELISPVALVNPQLFSIYQVFMITSTGKTNFQPYILQLMKVVQEKWYMNMPKEAINGPKVKVTLEFGIKKDGTLSEKPRVEQGSGHNTLDDAAAAAVRLSVPFDPFPAGYKSKEIRLRMVFLYNMPVESVLNN
jgi:TonB family protein